MYLFSDWSKKCEEKKTNTQKSWLLISNDFSFFFSFICIDWTLNTIILIMLRRHMLHGVAAPRLGIAVRKGNAAAVLGTLPQQAAPTPKGAQQTGSISILSETFFHSRTNSIMLNSDTYQAVEVDFSQAVYILTIMIIFIRTNLSKFVKQRAKINKKEKITY